MIYFSKTKCVSLLLLIIVSFSCSSAFGIHKKSLIATCKLKRNTFVRLAVNYNDDSETKNNDVTTTIDETDSLGENNFDADGFASYLGPYLLAFVASIAVTAGFFKFILLDN